VRKKFITHFLQLFIFAVLFYAILCLFTGCASARPLVSDIGNGASEYRAIQEDIRAGEVELAITGTRIEERVSELERSISASQSRSEEIDGILQRVRARELDSAFIEEWRNR